VAHRGRRRRAPLRLRLAAQRHGHVRDGRVVAAIIAAAAAVAAATIVAAAVVAAAAARGSRARVEALLTDLERFFAW